MAGVNNIRDKAKLLWIKSMKTIGNTATNIANNTKYKVDEMTIQNRRRELSGDLSHVVYSLWLKGNEFPPELTKMLEEIQALDNQLNDMRAEKYAQGETATTEKGIIKNNSEDNDETEETFGTEPATEKQPEEKMKKEEAGEATEEEETLDEVIIISSPSLQSEINGYFDDGTSVDKAAEKVNVSLNQLTDKIRAFSADDPNLNTGKEKAKKAVKKPEGTE